MSDDIPNSPGPFADTETAGVDASLPNPTGMVPRRRDLTGTAEPVPTPTPAPASTTPRDPEPRTDDSRVACRAPSLRPDGGHDSGHDGDPDGCRVKDGGIVVRLEAEGVLFHEGTGRSDGRWIAVDREGVVALDEVR